MSLNITDKKPLVLEILKRRGPSLPSQISGEIKLSLLFTSALLSEMVSDNTVKLSYLKIGGSPLYLLQGQEAMLENFIKHLHAKEKEAFELLKEKQILGDEEIEPVQRVCLAAMKDFAIQMKLNFHNQTKTFWRYYLLSEEEASKKVEEYFAGMPKILVEVEKKIPEFEKPDEIQETIKKLKEEKAIRSFAEAKPEVKQEPEKVEEQKILHPELLKKKLKRRVPTKKRQDFNSKVLDYIKEKEMFILKNFDEDNKLCIAETESKIGSIKFLVFSLHKKSINESDLSLAFTEGQHEKLPVLLVTNGKLTKKAEEYFKKFGSSIIINKI